MHLGFRSEGQSTLACLGTLGFLGQTSDSAPMTIATADPMITNGINSGGAVSGEGAGATWALKEQVKSAWESR